MIGLRCLRSSLSRPAAWKNYSTRQSTVAGIAIPQFVVGADNGFLPRKDPLSRLPVNRFKELEEMLQRLPKVTKDGKPGILSVEGMIEEVTKTIPEYDVDDIHDTAVLTALFRDYTFWASAYLLEPCDFQFRRDGTYGLGRQSLPHNIAVPLCKIAERLNAKPFMEYAMSYALYNWRRKDPNGAVDFDNLELIRSFEGSEHEAGFILVHVGMVAYTGQQVKYCLEIFDSIEKNDRAAFNRAMDDYNSTMRKINLVMDTMWSRSSSNAYNSFRAYIMGTKSQPMFPNGVIYEGVSDEPKFFRGESGANDTIIPTCDNLLQLTDRMPENPLTNVLKDFREYRPVTHNEWLSFVAQKSKKLNLSAYARLDANSAVRYLTAVDQVREFRDRHWRFTKEYIIKHSNHPVATGGSPIVTWLPNQLTTVLQTMMDVTKEIDTQKLESAAMRDELQRLENRASTQARVLEREVAELKKRFPNQ